jgi:tetratricopeptide (TPR) repeat protein
MPSISRVILSTAQAVIAGSLLLGAAAGCADSLIYAKDSSKAGMQLYNEGSYPEAAASFANATRQDPSDYKSFYFEGASYQNLHEYQQAVRSYRSCISVMPMTLDGKNDTAFRYRTIDALATSIAKSASVGVETVALEKKVAGKAQPEDQWLLAKIYRYSGDADAAIDAYNKAVLIDPNNFTVAKEAGLYEAGLGQSQRAVFALKKAQAINGDDEQVNLALRGLGVNTSANAGIDRDLSQTPSQNASTAAWNPNAPHATAADNAVSQTPRD